MTMEILSPLECIVPESTSVFSPIFTSPTMPSPFSSMAVPAPSANGWLNPVDIESIPDYMLEDVPAEYMRLDDISFADEQRISDIAKNLKLEVEEPIVCGAHTTSALLGNDDDELDTVDVSIEKSKLPEQMKNAKRAFPDGLAEDSQSQPQPISDGAKRKQPMKCRVTASKPHTPAVQTGAKKKQLKGKISKKSKTPSAPLAVVQSPSSVTSYTTSSASPKLTQITPSSTLSSSVKSALTSSVGARYNLPGTLRLPVPPRTTTGKKRGRKQIGRPSKNGREDEVLDADTLRARKRNRIAARRNRAIRKARHETMLQHSAQLAADNTKLRVTAEIIRDQIAQLLKTVQAKYGATVLRAIVNNTQTVMAPSA